MRNMNFMNPIPKNRQLELRRWFIFSALIMILVAIGGIVLVNIQWRVYCQTRNQKNTLLNELAQFDEIMNKERERKNEEASLYKKLSYLEACAQGPNHPVTILSSLHNYTKSIIVQSLVIDTESFEIKGLCNTPQQATALVHAIQKAPFCTSAHLVSLATTQHQLSCSIKGSLKLPTSS